MQRDLQNISMSRFIIIKLETAHSKSIGINSFAAYKANQKSTAT